MAIFSALDNTTNKLLEKSEEFITQSEAYYELKLFQIITSSLALLIKFTLVGAMCLIAFILIAIALTKLLGNALGNEIYGYLVTSSLFAGFGFMAYLMRKRIESLIIKKLSKIVFKTY